MAFRPTGDFVYVSNNGAGTVSVIRTADNTVVATIDVGSTPRGITCLPADEDGLPIRQTTDHFLLSLEKRTDIQEMKGVTDITPFEDPDPGREIPSFTRIAYQRALDEFPFLDDSSHKDDYARTKGYPAALLSGYVLCGYLSKYFEDFFGPDWFCGGEIELAFIKAVHQKQPITIRASITEKIGGKDGTRLTLAFRIQQENGSINVKGRAKGFLKKSSDNS